MPWTLTYALALLVAAARLWAVRSQLYAGETIEEGMGLYCNLYLLYYSPLHRLLYWRVRILVDDALFSHEQAMYWALYFARSCTVCCNPEQLVWWRVETWTYLTIRTFYFRLPVDGIWKGRQYNEVADLDSFSPASKHSHLTGTSSVLCQFCWVGFTLCRCILCRLYGLGGLGFVYLVGIPKIYVYFSDFPILLSL